MAPERRSASPEFEFEDDRPFITNYNNTNKFRPGDGVYLRIPGSTQLDGPYKIETQAGPGRYTLCDLNGYSARNGEVVSEADLQQSAK